MARVSSTSERQCRPWGSRPGGSLSPRRRSLCTPASPAHTSGSDGRHSPGWTWRTSSGRSGHSPSPAGQSSGSSDCQLSADCWLLWSVLSSYDSPQTGPALCTGLHLRLYNYSDINDQIIVFTFIFQQIISVWIQDIICPEDPNTKNGNDNEKIIWKNFVKHYL